MAQVVSVTDGDTVRVLMPDGAEEPLRLIGIDAPEDGSILAEEATDFLKSLVLGQEVRLVADVSDRDRFGRLLRYVYVGDLFVNQEMVRAGLAVAKRYAPDTAMALVLEAAQGTAEQEALGLFSSAATTTSATAATITSGVPPNPGGSVTCSDFATHAQAQEWFETFYPNYGDIAGLDGDNDGIACESLP